MKRKADRFLIVRFLLTATAMSIAVLLWFQGFVASPLSSPQRVSEKRFLHDYLERNKPDLQEERVLAESYWLRYKDIREDPFWGEQGRMGIWGARDHYKQFGKREGRIYQPIIRPTDMQKEQKLAEAYWQRYPEIRRSAIWGEKSSLGILGPRDHYHYVGKKRGKIWGTFDTP